MNINRKIVLALLSISLTSILVTSIFSYSVAKKAITQQSIGDLKNIALLKKNRIECIIDQNLEKFAIVSNTIPLKQNLERFLTDPSPENRCKVNHILDEAKSSSENFESISVFSSNGKIVASTDKAEIDTIVSDEELSYRRQKESPQEIFFFIEGQKKLKAHIIGMLQLKNNFLAFLSIEVDTGKLFSSIQYSGLGGIGEISLAIKDKNGKVFFIISSNLNQDSSLAYQLSQNEPTDLMIRALSNDKQFFENAVDNQGKPIIAVTSYILKPKLGLVVELKKAEAFKSIAQFRNIIVLAISLTIIATIIVSLYLARSITRPILKLAQTAKKIGDGQWSLEGESDTKDEVAILSQSFNHMTTSLIQANNELEHKVGRLKDEMINRKRVQEELLEAKTILEKIFVSLTEVVFIINPETGAIISCNPAIKLSFDYDVESMLGRTTEILYENQEAYKDFNRKLSVSLDASKIFKGEYKMRRKEGGIFHAEIMVTEISHDSKNKISLLYVVRDIDEQVRVMGKLRKAKEQWERTFDAIDDIVTIQDSQMRIVRVNKAATKLLEKGFENLIGKTCYNVFRGTTEPCENCPEILTFKNHKTYSGIVEHKTLGRTFQVTTSPMLDDTGRLQGIVHVAKDITDQKQLEAQYRQAQKMEAIGTLAGGIAHDFNNILGVIIGNTEIALDKEISEQDPARYSLEQILSASHRAKDLVHQILIFSRQKEDHVKPINITPIVKEAIKLLRSSLPSIIEIRQELKTNSDTVLGDPSQLFQVMMNLCTNAAYSMREEGGVMRIKLTDENLDFADRALPHPDSESRPHIMLSISDTGHGIEPSIIERIFDPYFTTKPVGESTGLGLAVVHGIVKNLGGTLAVESQPGKGCTFRVYLPLIESLAASEIRTTEPDPKGDEHVLFIDDEQPLIDVAKRMLMSLGYKITTRTNSLDALDAFRLNPGEFDLVITDMTMPHLAGDKLAEEILRIRPTIPVILCTGFSDLITKERIKSLGVRQILQKPLIRHEFALAIRKVLNEKQ